MQFLLLRQGAVSFLRALLLVAAASWGALAGGAVPAQEAPQADHGRQSAPDGEATATAAAAEAAILRALEQPTAMDFEETPLTEVAQFIAEKHKLPVIIDRRALADAGIDARIPIRFAIANVGLKNALNLMLREHGLTWVVENESLVITTQDVADNKLRTEIHDLRGVLDAEADIDRVLDLVMYIVAPDTWQANGGPGSIAAVGNALVVCNTRTVLAVVARLLAALTEVRKQAAEDRTGVPRHAMRLGDFTASDAIRRQLASKVDAEFREEPLVLVANFFGDKLRVPVQLDRRALADAAIETNLPIMAAVKGISARSALNLILEGHGLTWQVEHDVLMITTKEAAETRQSVQLYALGELGRSPSQGALLNAITSTVAPSHWEAAGGPGAVVFYRPCRCLIVRAIDDVHDQLESVLTRLQATISKLPEGDSHVDEDGMLLRVYMTRPLPGEERVPAEEVAKLVKQHVRPETWELEIDPEQAKALPLNFFVLQGKATIHVAGSLLLVRHTLEGQRAVEKFLALLGATPLQDPTDREREK